MLYLTTPSSSAHFAPGVNVVLVPRYLALGSQLNDTLTTSPSGTELAGGMFFTTGPSAATSSGHIVAVIEKAMTNAQAESLLTRLTHDASGERIGDDVRIASSDVYTLHLPRDVQSRIPYVELASSPLGEAPDYLSPTAILELVWNCLVAVGTALVNLVSNLIEAGIDFVCNLYSAVTTVINKIADAFNAFLEWAIEQVQQLITSMLDPLVNFISSAVNGFVNQVEAAFLCG